MMKNIETRKIIALAMTGALILFTGYCLVTGKPMIETFKDVSIMVISYYFGKSTALDTPNK